MDEQPLIVKIIAGIVILIFSGLATLILTAMCSAESGFTAVMLFLFFVVCIVPVALIAGPMFTRWCGVKAAKAISLPGDENFRDMPPEFSEIRAKIAKGNIDDALEELEGLLRENPKDPYVIELMSDVFIDKINDYNSATELLVEYLKKEGRSDRDVGFVMKLVDVYLDHNSNERAKTLLESELKKKYSPKAMEKLKKRLNGIMGVFRGH